MTRLPDPFIEAIHTHLEREFPGQVQRSWWDQESLAHAFEVSHESTHHHVLVSMAFIENCKDVVASLRMSELAEYMREARTQSRRFVVLGDEGAPRIRSVLL